MFGMTPNAYGEAETERSLVVRTPRDNERRGLSSTGTLACAPLHFFSVIRTAANKKTNCAQPGLAVLRKSTESAPG